ncbi:hypothetical protein OS493_029606 [Desmophyllum pertusum]|uniref:Uncharacterized protein n=1 Tax=Desmophyllum pertusum TaxID=174260 RepID=A0A9W9ZXJ1_9CNID|nr:hypothetical protein OS493_029606 [Desmophyllum pertusum]
MRGTFSDRSGPVHLFRVVKGSFTADFLGSPLAGGNQTLWISPPLKERRQFVGFGKVVVIIRTDPSKSQEFTVWYGFLTMRRRMGGTIMENQLTKNKNTVENEELIQVRQEVGDLRIELEKLKGDLRDEKNTNTGLRKTLQSALQEKEELKEKISELVTQKDEMRIWYEKNIADLRSEVVSLKEPLEGLGIEDVKEPIESGLKRKADETRLHDAIKVSKPSRFVHERREESNLTTTVEVKSKEFKLVLEDIQSFQDVIQKKIADPTDEPLVTLTDEPLVPSTDEPLVPSTDEPLVPSTDEPSVPSTDEPLTEETGSGSRNQEPLTEKPGTSSRNQEPLTEETDTVVTLTEVEMQPNEWVAVFFSIKFYIAKITSVDEHTVTVRYCDQRPNNLLN